MKLATNLKRCGKIEAEIDPRTSLCFRSHWPFAMFLIPRKSAEGLGEIVRRVSMFQQKMGRADSNHPLLEFTQVWKLRP